MHLMYPLAHSFMEVLEDELREILAEGYMRIREGDYALYAIVLDLSSRQR